MEEQTSRVAPRDNEAEIYVLGAILLENDALYGIMEILTPDSFYRGSHRSIYQSMLSLAEAGTPIDLVTMRDRLKAENKLESSGGGSYLVDIMNSTPTAGNIRHHALIVREKQILRGIVNVGTNMVAQAYEESNKSIELLDQAERELFALADTGSDAKFEIIHESLKTVFKEIESAYEHKGYLTGIPSGLKELDERTLGFQNSELSIVAARPSVGKTAFAIHIAVKVATSGKSVAMFSLEMPTSQIAMRAICAESKVSGTKLRSGYTSKDDWPRLTRAAGALSEAKLYIDDSPTLTAFEINGRSRRLQHSHGLDLVIVDYLQLVRHDLGRRQDKRAEVEEISRMMKALARELAVPVIVLSQLSRASEYRIDGKPRLSDLRESGAIEQDADMVLFLHRDKDSDEYSGVCDIILAKNRNGPTGETKVAFQREYGFFADLASQESYGL